MKKIVISLLLCVSLISCSESTKILKKDIILAKEIVLMHSEKSISNPLQQIESYCIVAQGETKDCELEFLIQLVNPNPQSTGFTAPYALSCKENSSSILKFGMISSDILYGLIREKTL